MARRTPQTFEKRQREHRKAEKAAQKRAKRAALKENPEPQPETTTNDYHAPDEVDDVASSE